MQKEETGKDERELNQEEMEQVAGGKGLSISQCKLCKGNFPASTISNNGGYCNDCVNVGEAVAGPLPDDVQWDEIIKKIKEGN